MPIYKEKGTKDGLQKYRVQVSYKAPDGSYKKHVRSVCGRQQAIAVEMQLKQHEEVASSRTFGALYREYLTTKRQELRETSVEKIESAYKNHIQSYFEGLRLSKINVAKIQKWKEQLHAKGNSTTTNKNTFGYLKAIFGYAEKHGYIKDNPMKRVDNFRDAYSVPDRAKIRYYTVAQFQAFIAGALEDAQATGNYNYYVFFHLAFFTGMRKGEINALKWSDLEGDQIHVRRSISQKLKGEDRETPPKNKSSYRTIQAPTRLLEILEGQRHRQQEKSGYSDENRICGGDACLRDTSIDVHNRRYADRAGLPHIKIHDYRHSHATLLANAGINIQEIARRLGHSDITQTLNTYSHLYPTEQERALKVLNDIG